MKRLTVHELADAVGIHPNTVRKYEKQGLIERASRDRNGWRTYAPSDVERVRKVVYPDSDRP